MRAFLKKLAKDVGGNVLVISGAGSLALIGGAGLGVDTVQWYLWKRELQNAVDAGALAGGQAMAQNANFTTAATTEVTRNRDNTIAGLNIVSILNPPSEGGYIGDNGAVEVIATIQQALPFSSLFIDSAPLIRARAVATTITEGEHCIYTLSETDVGIKINGDADLNLGCGVASNSRDQFSVDFEGSTGRLVGTPISAVGGIDYTSSNVLSGTVINPYTVEQPDPLAGKFDMNDLSYSSCDQSSRLRVRPSDNVTLRPSTGASTGYYHLCADAAINGTLTLESGVYVLDGANFNVGSQATVVGDGVTFILTNGATLSMAGGADVDITAPVASDPAYSSFPAPEFYGVLLYQDPDDDYSTSSLTGGAGANMNGIIYMPKTNLTFNGNSGMTSECLLMVTYTLTVSGEATMDNECGDFLPDPNNGALIVRLVE